MSVSVLITKHALFNLGVNSVTWSFQDSVLSIIRPRSLVLLVLVIIELEMTTCCCISFWFLVKNCKKWVLSYFRVKRLLRNQLLISTFFFFNMVYCFLHYFITILILQAYCFTLLAETILHYNSNTTSLLLHSFSWNCNI